MEKERELRTKREMWRNKHARHKIKRAWDGKERIMEDKENEKERKR